MKAPDPELKRELDAFITATGITPDVGGRCPCGGVFAAVGADYSVHHSQPTCPDFEAKEPDAYLRDIRMGLSD